MTQTEPIPTASPNQDATVGYKAWLPSPNGGSETIEIVLPLGAAPELLDQAIEQWQRMRAEGQRALKTTQGPPPERQDVVISFGKYSGRTLGAILVIDREYVGWLADKAREPAIQSAARALLATFPVRPAPPEPAAPGALDEPPF